MRALRHPRERRAPRVEVELAELDAADADRSAVGRTRPSSTLSSVDLPQPLGPTSAEHLARLDRERDVVERRLAAIGIA